jgi:hypothetical protein
VRVVAKNSGHSRGATLLTTNGRGVVVVGKKDVRFSERDITALGDGDAGVAVVIRGDVTRVSANGLRVTDATGSKEILIAIDKATAKSFSVGSGVEARGVLLTQKDGFELVAMSASPSAPLGKNDAGTNNRAPTAFASPTPTTSHSLPLLLVALTAIAVGTYFWKTRAKPPSDGLPLDFTVEDFES